MEIGDTVSSGLAERIGAIALVFVFGCGGGSCLKKAIVGDSEEEKTSTGASAEGSAESEEGGDEEKPSMGSLEDPPLFRLTWEEFVDIDLVVKLPPDDSGDRIKLGVMTAPGPGGGEYETDGKGCMGPNCERDDSPYDEWIFWPKDAEPQSGTYDVLVKHEDYQTWEAQSGEPVEVAYRLEAYDAQSPEEAEGQDPIETWTGTLEPTDDETFTKVTTFEIE